MANIETLAGATRYYEEAAAPSTPSAGQGVTYFKTDGKFYAKNDGGTEYDLTASGSGTTLINLAIGPYSPLQVPDQSLDLGVNNRAMMVPFQVFADVTVDTAWWICATSAGNIDIGIYNSSLARLGSTGSFASPGTGKQSQALTGSVALTAGTLYYAAFVSSSTTAKFYGTEYGASINPGFTFFRRMESALPLPDPFVSAADNDLGRMVAVWFEAV